VEGKSLASIVQGEATEVRPYLFAAYRGCQRMVRDNRWKLIEYFVGDQRHTQLFDLSVDPDELSNLASKVNNADVLARLRGELQRLGAEFNDPHVAFYSGKSFGPEQ
jgi:arylsulfatase A-like enzyme